MPKNRIFSSENLDRQVRQLSPAPPQWDWTDGSRIPRPPSPIQELGLAALTDWISTGYGLGTRSMVERNPIYRPFKNNPYSTVGALALTDLAALPLLRRLEKRSPRVAKPVLKALAAYRMGLTLNNMNLVRKNRRP